MKTKQNMQPNLPDNEVALTEVIEEKIRELNIRCIQCGLVLEDPYSLAGSFACETCVRACYKGRPASVIKEELRCRHDDALHQIAKSDQ